MILNSNKFYKNNTLKYFSYVPSTAKHSKLHSASNFAEVPTILMQVHHPFFKKIILSYIRSVNIQ